MASRMKPLCYLIRTSHSSRSLAGTGYFLRWNRRGGIRTLVVLFELLEEMVAWGCRNGRFNEQFQILPLELKVKFIWLLSYVFLTVLDLPARFISATFHVDKSLKMAAKLGDCRKLGKFTEL